MMVAVNFSTNFSINVSNMSIVQSWTNMSTPSDYVNPVLTWWEGEIGMWLWFFIFFVTIGIVYIKTESAYATAATVVLISAVTIWKLPPPAEHFAYLFLVAVVIALLYRALIWRSAT